MTNTTPQEALESLICDLNETNETNENVLQMSIDIQTVRQALTDHEKLKAENAALREAVSDLSTGIDYALGKTLEDICECVEAPKEYNKAKSGIRKRFKSVFEAWKVKHVATIKETENDR